MRITITGICGFVGSSLALFFREAYQNASICGIDNLSRPGSAINHAVLKSRGVRVIHGDIRMSSDIDALPDCDWVIDAAANPSVLAGIDGRSSSRQLMEHNLGGTLNVLEYCRRSSAGLVLLSTSRVYSIPALAALPLRTCGQRFALDTQQPLPTGISAAGVREDFSVSPPISLYGSTKLASESIALEYGVTFGFPVWVNRCGVLAGAVQFGTAEQGIFSYWIRAHAARRPIRYIGFEGQGFQVRDALHPHDLGALILLQIALGKPLQPRVYNVGGGVESSMSLRELTDWCDERFGAHRPGVDLTPRRFDIPWLIMDASDIARLDWKISRPLQSILSEIADHASRNPDWLTHSGAV